MNLEALVIRKLNIESGVSKSGNEWKKGTLIVETQGQYPKQIAISNMKNVDEFMALEIGKPYKFGIDIESREYNGKFYTNVNAFSFQPMQGQQAPPQQPYTQPQQTYARPQGGYAPSPQSSGYQQPPQGYTQGYQKPPQSQFPTEEDIPF